MFLKSVGSHWGQIGAKNCSPQKAPKILHSGIRVSQVARMISKKRETNKQTWLTPLGVWKARGCIWLTPLLSHRSRAIEDFLTWKSCFYDHTNKIPKQPEQIIPCSHPPLPAALEWDFPPVHQLHRNTWPNKRCLITSKSNCSDFKGDIIRNNPPPLKKDNDLSYIHQRFLSLSVTCLLFSAEQIGRRQCTRLLVPPKKNIEMCVNENYITMFQASVQGIWKQCSQCWCSRRRRNVC